MRHKHHSNYIRNLIRLSLQSGRYNKGEIFFFFGVFPVRSTIAIGNAQYLSRSSMQVGSDYGQIN